MFSATTAGCIIASYARQLVGNTIPWAPRGAREITQFRNINEGVFGDILVIEVAMAPGVKCLAASGMLLRTISRDMPLGPTAHMSWPEISRGYDENNPDIHRQQAIAIAIRTRPGERGFSIIGVGRSWRTSSAADKLSTGATPRNGHPRLRAWPRWGKRGGSFTLSQCVSRAG